MLFPSPEFIQHVIHDIQGDFLGVAGLCQSMKKGLQKKKDVEGLLDILIENCNTYKYKLGNFLEFTRMQAGLNRTVRGPVNIRRLLNQVIDEYEMLRIDKDTRVSLDISPRMPDECSCDEGKVQLLVSNLFVNAVYFSPAASSVTITTAFSASPSTDPHHRINAVTSDALSPHPDRWTISVTDNGDGMTQQQLDAVFNVDPAGRSVLCNSAGLGLIISKWLTEDVLDGTLRLESRSGEGTCVQVELPFYPYESEIHP